MRDFARYVRDVLNTGWGTAFVVAGAVSTAVTFVLIYKPSFVLPYWVPGAISIVAWLLAPYRVYAKRCREIDALRAQQQQPRRAALVLMDEGGSFYIRRINPSTRHDTGTYLQLSVSIENKGNRPSTIALYDLGIEELAEFKGVRPSPQGQVPGRRAVYSVNTENVASYIAVPAEGIVGHRLIPFMLERAPLPDTRSLHVQLTAIDTEGNQATIQLVAAERL